MNQVVIIIQSIELFKQIDPHIIVDLMYDQPINSYDLIQYQFYLLYAKLKNMQLFNIIIMLSIIQYTSSILTINIENTSLIAVSDAHLEDYFQKIQTKANKQKNLLNFINLRSIQVFNYSPPNKNQGLYLTTSGYIQKIRYIMTQIKMNTYMSILALEQLAKNLQQLKHILKQAFQYSAKQIIFIVPTFFNIHKRKMIKDSLKISGLDLLRIFTNQMLACISYCYDQINQKSQEIYVIVVRFDERILDISIIYVEQQIYQRVYISPQLSIGPNIESINVQFQKIKKVYQKINNSNKDHHIVAYGNLMHFNQIQPIMTKMFNKDIRLISSQQIYEASLIAYTQSKKYNESIDLLMIDKICEELILDIDGKIIKISKQQTLPIKKEVRVTTTYDYQQKILIKIYEKDIHNLITIYQISNIPKFKKSYVLIVIQLYIDIDGILEVEGYQLRVAKMGNLDEIVIKQIQSVQL